MYRHRSFAAQAKPALIFRKGDHQPTLFRDQLPGGIARTGELVGGEGLLRRIAQFAEFDHSTHPFGSRCISSMRSAMMLRCTSSLPAAMVHA